MENISPADKNHEYPLKDERTPLQPGPDGKIRGEIKQEKIIIEREGKQIEVLATTEQF
jgi:hypothetical protein